MTIDELRARASSAVACPTCGSPVSVHTGDGGTSSYDPLISEEEFEALLDELDEARALSDRLAALAAKEIEKNPALAIPGYRKGELARAALNRLEEM